MLDSYLEYTSILTNVLNGYKWGNVDRLTNAVFDAWSEKRQVFICGNGGSAANAVHLANDLLYGASAPHEVGIRVEALSANTAVLTCLANDISYEEIFSQQLRVKANSDDVLVILSGSGESENVVRALKTGNSIGMHTFAIVGYSGGQCGRLAETVIHFPVDDMQISEDLQLIVGHMCMQRLRQLIHETIAK